LQLVVILDTEDRRTVSWIRGLDSDTIGSTIGTHRMGITILKK
jgi:hypothetical protein